MPPETSGGHAATIRVATSLAKFCEPRKPASAVTRIRNGNMDIRTDSAMWLAIAQPSSALKRLKASQATRLHRRIAFKGRQPPHRIGTGFIPSFAEPSVGAKRGRAGRILIGFCALHA